MVLAHKKNESRVKEFFSSKLKYLLVLFPIIGLSTMITAITSVFSAPAFSESTIVPYVFIVVGLITAMVPLLPMFTLTEAMALCSMALYVAFVAAMGSTSVHADTNTKFVTQDYMQEHHISDASQVEAEHIGGHAYKFTNHKEDKTEYVVYKVSPGKIESKHNVSKHTAESFKDE